VRPKFHKKCPCLGTHFQESSARRALAVALILSSPAAITAFASASVVTGDSIGLSTKSRRPALGQILLAVAIVLLGGFILNRRAGEHGQGLAVSAETDDLFGCARRTGAVEPVHNVDIHLGAIGISTRWGVVLRRPWLCRGGPAILSEARRCGNDLIVSERKQ
jgi:hypothetical protein